MSIKFVNYARGVPLALKVLGSHLFKKSREVWDSAWNKLRVVPNERIQGALEISFAGLDSKEKEIFLDIACFFKGMNKDFVKKRLDEGGCFEDVITTLVDKSLITLSGNYLEMHDLLQEMGWKIARGPFSKEIGNHSRLWIHDNICHVLKNNTGTASIQGIFLRYPIDGEINLKPDVFTKMSSLRLLQITLFPRSGSKIHLPRGGLDSFPDTLSYLRWDYCPLESLGTPRDLVYLEMTKSQLEKLWNEDQHDLSNVNYIDLKDSKKLTCLPDLSQANLKILNLEGCKSLVELPPLKFQDIAHKLTKKETDELFPNLGKHYNSSLIVRSSNVQGLNLGSCSNLKTLSKMSGSINFISLRETRIEELHPSIGSLTNLVFLDLAYCECLKNLPRSICGLGSLEYLNVSGCFSIDKFPELLKNIRRLYLCETSIEHVPSSSFECLPCLEILVMTHCERLVSLPTSICKLKSLRKLSLPHCLELKTFPEILEPMENLEELDLSVTGIKDIPSSSFECLPCLEILAMRHCKRLVSLPTSICKLKSLRKLSLSHCLELKTFPEILEPMENLEELDLFGTGIKDIPSSIENLVMLDALDMRWCKNLESIPTSICKLKSLKTLKPSFCSKLKTFPEILEPMENLEELDLSGTGIKDIPSSIENLVMLDALVMRWCTNLESIPTSICKLKSLKTLILSFCPKLKTFPEILEPMKNLEELNLSVTGIKDIPSSIMNLVILETLDLGFCENLESLPTSVYYMGKLEHLRVAGCPLFCPPSVLSLLPALDPSGTTSCELKCGGYCAGKNQVFLLEYWDCNENIIHSTRLNRYRYKFCKHFTYCECSIFYAIYNIFMSTYFHSNILERQKVSFYYSGNKIARWFNYQFSGSSIKVSFRRLWHNATFLGFALCIVVDFDKGFSNPEYLDLNCECRLTSNNSRNHTYRWTLQTHSNDDSNLENHGLDWSSDHVFIWNLYWKEYYRYETGDLFEFNLRQLTDAFGKHRVKQCGIRILYPQDTKELPGGDINSDANEPNPKRIKS